MEGHVFLFVIEKADTPKKGGRILPEVHRIGAIKCSLAMPYDNARRSFLFFTDARTEESTYLLSDPALQAASAKTWVFEHLKKFRQIALAGFQN